MILEKRVGRRFRKGEYEIIREGGREGKPE